MKHIFAIMFIISFFTACNAILQDDKAEISYHITLMILTGGIYQILNKLDEMKK